MSDQAGYHFDPELLSLLSLVEHRVQGSRRCHRVSKQSEDTSAAEALRSDAACCGFSGRVSSSSLDGLNDSLDISLSAEFCEYHFNLWSH